ncbi:PREDICTED: elongation factor 1-beta-like [Elephantulus edwardii]|uniref:elongation factor 1-beta-like n=1 Tax=Elephantulus edwardii TaxID=28737 RepID=UPI0003F0C5EE|nr:PREDICTED: elongation factor 1-beta-like [Elephantulus edwardii]
MGFGDLKTTTGLQDLNDYLADKSYIEVYVPSQANVAVFETICRPPTANLCHALYTTGNGAADSRDDSDIDFFGSADDEKSEEAKKLREDCLAQYESKKAKKPALVAKFSILLDVKLWHDETDMAKLEECVRSIQADGLVWGTSKLVPVRYGIEKLQIQCIAKDEHVGPDKLEEQITAFGDYMQSMDVAAFNKI